MKKILTYFKELMAIFFRRLPNPYLGFKEAKAEMVSIAIMYNTTLTNVPIVREEAELIGSLHNFTNYSEMLACMQWLGCSDVNEFYELLTAYRNCHQRSIRTQYLYAKTGDTVINSLRRIGIIIKPKPCKLRVGDYLPTTYGIA